MNTRPRKLVFEIIEHNQATRHYYEYTLSDDDQYLRWVCSCGATGQWRHLEQDAYDGWLGHIARTKRAHA